MVASVLTQVWPYIVVGNLNLLENPCTIANYAQLSKDTFCRLTIVQWGGK